MGATCPTIWSHAVQTWSVFFNFDNVRGKIGKEKRHWWAFNRMSREIDACDRRETFSMDTYRVYHQRHPTNRPKHQQEQSTNAPCFPTGIGFNPRHNVMLMAVGTCPHRRGVATEAVSSQSIDVASSTRIRHLANGYRLRGGEGARSDRVGGGGDYRGFGGSRLYILVIWMRECRWENNMSKVSAWSVRERPFAMNASSRKAVSTTKTTAHRCYEDCSRIDPFQFNWTNNNVINVHAGMLRGIPFQKGVDDYGFEISLSRHVFSNGTSHLAAAREAFSLCPWTWKSERGWYFLSPDTAPI